MTMIDPAAAVQLFTGDELPAPSHRPRLSQIHGQQHTRADWGRYSSTLDAARACLVYVVRDGDREERFPIESFEALGAAIELATLLEGITGREQSELWSFLANRREAVVALSGESPLLWQVRARIDDYSQVVRWACDALDVQQLDEPDVFAYGPNYDAAHAVIDLTAAVIVLGRLAVFAASVDVEEAAL